MDALVEECGQDGRFLIVAIRDDRTSKPLTPASQTVRCASHAGIAQLVEHDLAKVGVASSSLVSRSRKADETSVRRGFVFYAVRRARQEGASFRRRCCVLSRASPSAWWQSGHAAACKAAYAGSIPTLASTSRMRHCLPPFAERANIRHATQAARGARMAKSVDARDLKSLGGNPMPVRFRLRAPSDCFKASHQVPKTQLNPHVSGVFCASAFHCYALLS